MSKEIEWLPEISSDFAILDVKRGRSELSKFLMKNRRGKAVLLIEAKVDYVWGGDDGISQEFALSIKSMRWKP